MKEERLREIKKAIDTKAETIRTCGCTIVKLKDDIHKLKSEEVGIKYNIFVGSTVLNRKGKRFKVVGFDYFLNDEPPWLLCNPQINDGSYGLSTRRVYDYTLEKSTEK